MSHSLFEVHEFIRRVIALNLPEALWVRCELADVKDSRGHFYLDLVQKKEDGDEIIAQGQAVIWQKNYRALQKKLGLDMALLLQPGMEILLLAKPEFHERYGLKLMVEDIDPTYTMGKLELKRREIIRQLQAQNLLEKNRRLPLPPVVQRVAVLSSERAAGFQDFLKHLTENSFGYQFQIEFFQAAVQGIQVEKEMADQLQKLARRAADFDAVAIIRGGGARLDLAAFDSLELGKTVANLPLPVLTGIGHDVDETVLDLVAHTSLKTPTAVADFILHHNFAFESGVVNLGQVVKNIGQQALKEKDGQLRHLSQLLDFQLKNNFRQQKLMLDFIEKEIPVQLASHFSKQKIQLESLEKIVRLLSPETAMRRGFSIVLKNGKQVTDASELAVGEEVEVRLHRGAFIGTVKILQK
ncbi:MAG: exodeoxyribonuclease VII large subunit [Bacteroidetes bacterium]|nr:exodeoxyribonuclease VII large subunit [Bacteroidota bacterium]